MKNAIIYVHGKGGNAEEANRYKQFFDDSFEIIGFDYKSLSGNNNSEYVTAYKMLGNTGIQRF